MGQKVHPIGFRLAVTKNWNSCYYVSKKDIKKNLQEDVNIRNTIHSMFPNASIKKIQIDKFSHKINITIETSTSSHFANKKGNNIDKLNDSIKAIAQGYNVFIKIIDIKTPDIDATSIAHSIAQQLSSRSSLPYRRVLKRASIGAMMAGAKGIKIICSGRIAGAEIARTEKVLLGSIPLHTLRADIDYATEVARTTYGAIGIKVFVYKK